MIRGAILALVVGLVLAGAAFAADASTANDHFFTTHLPEPDRAEVFFFPYPAPGSPNPVVQLNEHAARKLAALIRHQSIGNNFGSRCNNPYYGVRFYRDGKLIADESFCFGCHWITPMKSDLHAVTSEEGFDVETPQAHELANYFHDTLKAAAVVPK